MNVAHLRPGDCVLYSERNPLAFAVRVKTWSPVNHAEVYVGGGLCVTARERGVGLYGYRDEPVHAVLRPLGRLDWEAANRWFHTVAGQPYDALGLLRFWGVGRRSDGAQFCSEFCVRWYRAAGFEPFVPTVDPETVPPGLFLYSPWFAPVDGAA